MKTGAKKRKKKRHQRLPWYWKIQILLQIVAICAIGYYVFGDTVRFYINTVRELQQEAKALVEGVSESDFYTGQASYAYAQDGTVISVWKGSRDVCYVPLSAMPQTVIDAMVCMEDKRFYEHRGVDYKALMRALGALIKNGRVTQGGSTITMQLARNKYLTQEVSWQRKVEEIFIAMELEDIFTKEQIMEFYLNNIYFGNGYYGIGAASLGYFGKNVWELDLAQMAYLCAIPNNPTLYDPIKSGENTEKRKELILAEMLRDQYISEQEYDEAVRTTIALAKPQKVEKNDYVETYTAYCTVRALMELHGFSFCYEFESEDDRRAYEAEYVEYYEACQSLLYTEGYQIYTSLDLGIQWQLQDSVNRKLSDFTDTNDEGVYTFQGAAVCIENATGYVKAIVGGRSQDFDVYTLNRAYQSFRQPGSSIKPLIVYTPLFERNYTPETLVEDRPIAGGPKNATGYYAGTITVRRAVEESINTVAWKLFDELTPAVGLSYLKEMEFSQIVPEDLGLPSALGGFTIGVSPLEMAAAYAAIANEGVFRSPTCIVRIVAPDGTVIYEPDRSGKRVYTQAAAALMESALAGVMERGTGKLVRLSDVFCAGKTGTTNECKDSWFVGYTDRYTTSVWAGYDMPREIAGLTGPAYSGYIWNDFMETIKYW